MFGLKKYYKLFQKVILGITKLKNFNRSFSRETRTKMGQIIAEISKQVLSDPHYGKQSFKGHSASYILFYNNFHSFPQILHRICSQRKATELKAVFINKMSMSRHIKSSPVPLATFYLRRCLAEMVLTSPVISQYL